MKARAVELGTDDWKLVGSVGGFALVTKWASEQSLWIDLRQWPAELGRSVKGWIRSVAVDRDGYVATLGGWTKQAVTLYEPGLGAKRDLPSPDVSGFRSVGFLGGLPVVIPGNLAAEGLSSPLTYAAMPLIFDGDRWIQIPGLSPGGGGKAWEQSGTVALPFGIDWLIWHGRVYEWMSGRLVPATSVDLPANTSHAAIESFIAVNEAVYAIAEDRLVKIMRGASAIERVGKRKVTSIAAYGRQIVYGEATSRHWLFDPTTSKEVELDTKILGKDHGRIFSGPCGLVALASGCSAIASLRS